MNTTRRDALTGAATLAIGAALPAFAQTPRKGGILTAHVSGEQRVLNPAIRASTGVEDDGIARRPRRIGEARRRAGDLVGGGAGRQDRHLPAPRGRLMARRQALHRRRRAVHRDGPLEEISELRLPAAAIPGCGRHARPAYGDLPVFAPDAARPAAPGALRPRLHRAATYLRGHQHPGESGQHRTDRHGTVQVRVVDPRAVRRTRALRRLLEPRPPAEGQETRLQARRR